MTIMAHPEIVMPLWLITVIASLLTAHRYGPKATGKRT